MIPLLLHDTALLLVAWVLGALVGWQREASGRAAGLRTHILVCVGSCLLTRVSFNTGGDHGRIAAQIVTGIGFLGAGVILRRGVSVRGLTTAGTIWVVAALGIAAGASVRMAILGCIATLLTLFTLTVAKRLETAIGGQDRRRATLSITLPRGTGSVSRTIEALTEIGADVIGFSNDSDLSDSGDDHRIEIELRLRQDVTRADMTRTLTERLPGVSFDWE